VRPRQLLACAAEHGVCLRLRPRVGEHVVAGTTLAWIWHDSPRDPAPDWRVFSPILDAAVRVGFERTLEQDAALGIRQLVDVACKALSPAVNDPYTAVQAVDHLSVIFCALARRPLGNHVLRGDHGAAVIVPGRRFTDYLAVMCGLIRRYGAREPTVAHALLRLLGNCAAVAGDDPDRCAAIEEQARIILADAEREVAQPADLALVHAGVESVRQTVAENRLESRQAADGADESENRAVSSPLLSVTTQARTELPSTGRNSTVCTRPATVTRRLLVSAEIGMTPGGSAARRTPPLAGPAWAGLASPLGLA